jgi:hypothetical protein
VLPLESGVTKPEESTEATEGLSELQEDKEVTSWEELSEK